MTAGHDQVVAACNVPGRGVNHPYLCLCLWNTPHA